MLEEYLVNLVQILVWNTMHARIYQDVELQHFAECKSTCCWLLCPTVLCTAGDTWGPCRCADQ